MSDYSYNLWKLHELTSSDPRMYIDIIVTNARYNKIQAIKYRGDTVFVISEEQYLRLINT